jgi:hypothetical protein
MITEEQFIEMVSELMDTTKADALEKAKSLYRSGAIDPESYDDNFILPKIFMTAYADRINDMWHPRRLSKTQEEIKNIKHFI